MSWNDFLPQLAVEHEVLESLFTEIGTPENEKARQCQALFDKFLETIRECIDMVGQDKTRLTHEIDRMLESIRSLTDLLGQDEQAVASVVESFQGMVSTLPLASSDFCVHIVLEFTTDHKCFPISISNRLCGIDTRSYQTNTASSWR